VDSVYESVIMLCKLISLLYLFVLLTFEEKGGHWTSINVTKWLFKWLRRLKS